jgi:predicted DCC family thiol-disulfide oxidoreductase YuxK
LNSHLIFFDDECPFCHKAVRHIIEIDEDKEFLFAPLRGESAREILAGPQKELRSMNSIVLAENYQSTHRRFFTKSHAIFRIYWLVGNGWGLIGILHFLPSFIGNFFYDWFAAHRHQFKLKIREAIGPSDRFLP